MIYYTYHVDNKSYSLNEEEHRQVVDIIKAGKTGLVILRNGKLIINLSFIRSVEVDEESVRMDGQEKQNFKRLSMPDAEEMKQRQERIRKELAKIRVELGERLGWMVKERNERQ